MTLVPAGSVRFPNAAEVPDFRVEHHMDAKHADALDRFAQFALIAAREAVADSGIVFDPALREASAIVTGSCSRRQDHRRRWFPRPLRAQPYALSAAHDSQSDGQRRSQPHLTRIRHHRSGLHGFDGVLFIQSRHRPGILDGPQRRRGNRHRRRQRSAVFARHLKAWEAMRVVSPDTCRPFSRDRRGMILGEGAAMLVLEPLDPPAPAAPASGARSPASACQRRASPHPAISIGAARAMRAALRDAGLAPEAVGYINAHGTGTEPTTRPKPPPSARFSAATRAPVSSTKSMHGHALGAAGAIEAAATLLARHTRRRDPADCKFTEPDPACDLDVVPNSARQAQIEQALSNSFAFGGLNAVLAFTR